jgi:hypothetical protein
MTIKVTIANGEGEGGRTVRVTENHFDKNRAAATRGESTELKPGESRTWHIHLLKDLLVEERDPDNRT